MQLNNFRMITKEELRTVNSVLSKGFGFRNQVVSGSCVIQDNEKEYHITLQEDNRYKSDPMLKAIGKVIKHKLNAAEVFFMGIKIA